MRISAFQLKILDLFLARRRELVTTFDQALEGDEQRPFHRDPDGILVGITYLCLRLLTLP